MVERNILYLSVKRDKVYLVDAPSSQEMDDLIAPLAASGFPLQTAVAVAIRKLELYQLEEEVAWRHSDGSDRFLHMVAVGSQVRIVIECKKTNQDKLIFLLPASGEKEADSQLLECIYFDNTPDMTRGSVKWGTAVTRERSPEVSFCVTKSASSNRVLENDIQPLVRGTEAYVMDRYQDLPQGKREVQTVPCIPLLVTTAPMFLARYKPDEVPLDTGIHQARSEQLTPIWVDKFPGAISSTPFMPVVP